MCSYLNLLELTFHISTNVSLTYNNQRVKAKETRPLNIWQKRQNRLTENTNELDKPNVNFHSKIESK